MHKQIAGTVPSVTNIAEALRYSFQKMKEFKSFGYLMPEYSVDNHFTPEYPVSTLFFHSMMKDLLVYHTEQWMFNVPYDPLLRPAGKKIIRTKVTEKEKSAMNDEMTIDDVLSDTEGEKKAKAASNKRKTEYSRENHKTPDTATQASKIHASSTSSTSKTPLNSRNASSVIRVGRLQSQNSAAVNRVGSNDNANSKQQHSQKDLYLFSYILQTFTSLSILFQK